MEHTSHRKKAITSGTVFVGSLILLSIILTAISAYYFNNIISFQKTYSGIKIDGYAVEGMTKNELAQYATNVIANDFLKKEAVFVYNDRKYKIYFKDAAYIKINDAVEKAFSTGRTGNTLKRFLSIVKAGIFGVNISTKVIYKDNYINKTLSAIKDDIDQSKVDVSYKILYDMLLINSGHNELKVNLKNLTDDFLSLLEKKESDIIDIGVEVIPKKNLAPDFVAKQMKTQKKDASISVIDNRTVEITPHSHKKDIDIDLLKNAIDESELKDDIVINIPIIIERADITKEHLEKVLFKDTIGEFSTVFSTLTQNGLNRASNIALACSVIDGYILSPQEEFSLNNVTGPRTESRGYKVAHMYYAGKIIDSAGGGICQISSTLYNAVLKAGLEVTERTNHQLTVSYVPLGADATVNFGTKDFKFVNNTKMPVKIECHVEGNTLHMKLTGTDEHPEIDYVFKNEIISTIPYKTVYEYSDLLEAGEETLKSSGKTGYIVKAYIVKYEEGIEKEKIYLHTNYYDKLDQVIVKGTKNSD